MKQRSLAVAITLRIIWCGLAPANIWWALWYVRVPVFVQCHLWPWGKEIFRPEKKKKITSLATTLLQSVCHHRNKSNQIQTEETDIHSQDVWVYENGLQAQQKTLAQTLALFPWRCPSNSLFASWVFTVHWYNCCKTTKHPGHLEKYLKLMRGVKKKNSFRFHLQGYQQTHSLLASSHESKSTLVLSFP